MLSALWTPAFAWAAVVAFGSSAWFGVVAGIGATCWLQVDRIRAHGGWAEHRRIATAIDEHRDPGTEHRQDLDGEALQLVTRQAQVIWMGPLIVAALGVACLVLASLRSDPLLALPALVFILGSGAHAVMVRRAVANAAWWLADPPPVTEAAEP